MTDWLYPFPANIELCAVCYTGAAAVCTGPGSRVGTSVQTTLDLNMDKLQVRQPRDMDTNNSTPAISGVDSPVSISITHKADTPCVGLLALFFPHTLRSLPRRQSAFSGCTGQLRRRSLPVIHYPLIPNTYNTTGYISQTLCATTTRTNLIILYPAKPKGRVAVITVLHTRRRWLWQQRRSYTTRARAKQPRFPTVPR